MSIQILGLRYFSYPKKASPRMHECFFDNNWRAKNVPHLLENIEQIVAEIPDKFRFNLFYTAANCAEVKGRKMVSQTTIPYDIDGIDLDRIDEYIQPILNAIGDLKYEEVGIIATGNGLQFLVETDKAITDKEYFAQSKKHYNKISENINIVLDHLKLPGKADSSVWSPARLLRLPLTRNIKTPEQGYKNKNSVKDATIIQRVMRVQKGYCVENIGVIDKTETETTISNYPLPDTPSILDECLFLQHCKANADKLPEEQWYAMLSITSRLEDGEQISHAYSEPYPGYTYEETQNKIVQALESAGPRRCTNIEGMFPDCIHCPHHEKIASPILIQGESYIRTKDNGFYEVERGENGVIKRGKPNYDDLVKYFEQQHSFVCTESELMFTWNGTHWVRFKDAYINKFAEENFKPKPTSTMRAEFRKKLYCYNVVPDDFFSSTIENAINLKNGILNLKADPPELIPHSKDYGFQTVAAYDYDPHKICPFFDRFMVDVTRGDEQIKKALMQFVAYALTDTDCLEAKALILLGDGSNGKSTFLDVIKLLGGEESYCSLTLGELQNEQARVMLQGKMMNIAEETPTKALMESSTFKNIVSGGEISVKEVYKPPYRIKNRTKMLVACNELPPSFDASKGLLRRMMIVPFKATFEGKNKDKYLPRKLKKELPGILNRVIEAYHEYKDADEFTESKAIENEITQYQEDNDPILTYFRSEVLITNELDSYGVNLLDLYHGYITYADENGIHYRPSSAIFSKNLRRIIPDSDYRITRKRVNGKLVRWCQGVTMAGNAINF